MKTLIAITECEKHGTFNESNKQYEVKVPLPSNKRARVAGCPACRKEKVTKTTNT